MNGDWRWGGDKVRQSRHNMNMSKEWAECRMQMEAKATEKQSVKAALNYAQEKKIQIC